MKIFLLTAFTIVLSISAFKRFSMKKPTFTLFLLFVLFIPVFSQTDTKALTNKDVVEMVVEKIPDSIIISKIEASKGQFQTEIADIKQLTEKGVSETVISAMIKKSAEKPPKTVEYSNNNAEYGNLSEITGKTSLCLRVGDVKSREIITKALRKYPALKITDNQKDCDFGVWFGMERVNVGSNVFLGTVNNMVVVGRLLVYTYLPLKENEDVGRIRIVWQKDKKQDYSGGLTFDKHPANAINDFLKDFSKLK